MLSKKEISRLFKSVKEYKTEELVDILTALADYVAESEEKRDKAIKQLEEFNKDEEIVKLKEQLQNKQEKIKNSQVFIIEPEEVELIRKWKTQHEAEEHGGNSYAGAVGGRYTYEFVPTSIGTVGVVKCTCGKHFDFTSYDKW